MTYTNIANAHVYIFCVKQKLINTSKYIFTIVIRSVFWSFFFYYFIIIYVLQLYIYIFFAKFNKPSATGSYYHPAADMMMITTTAFSREQLEAKAKVQCIWLLNPALFYVRSIGNINLLLQNSRNYCPIIIL